MSPEHTSKTPPRAGLFALLGGPLDLKGTSATNTGHRSGMPARLILVALATLGALGFAATPALAVAPVLGEASVENVAATSATLLAQVNPEGAETTYRFEYGMSASYGESIPVPGGLAGAGTSVVEVQAHPQDLLAGTEYHYRVVAESAGGKSEGPDRTFTTRPPGSELVLPDHRAWELVSPLEKDGMQMLPVPETLSQAAEDGSAITYVASGPFAAEAPAASETTQVLSRRGASGWSSQNITPPLEEPIVPATNLESEYSRFSPNLEYGLVEPWNSSRHSSEAMERTLYVRNNTTGEYQALVTPANTASGIKVAGKNFSSWDLIAETATPDLSHVILSFHAEEGKELTDQGKPAAIEANYYEWAGGQLQLIDELPGGAKGGGIGIGAEGNERHAVSNDGSRVFWHSEGRQYIRNVPAAETIVAYEGGAEGGATFEDASSDGSRVFFNAYGAGLDVYEVESGKRTLLTVPQHAGEAVEVKGAVIGVSEDGSYVYLVAGGVLSENENAMGEKAVPGANNLYVLHGELVGGVTEWQTSFIAGLAFEDRNDWGRERAEGHGDSPLDLEDMTASVSPDGRYLAFMSDMSLTGYDNVDANSAQRDEEVYLYDAQSGRLVCASCDPTGARPVGRQETGGGITNLNQSWSDGQWIAASVPTPLQSGFAELSGSSYTAYQPRYLSDDGRVFFDSRDALVSQDTDGTEDVYEYEPEGVGDCSSSSVTYSAKARGCISLVSGGRGTHESVFVDASASGNDVFFETSEDLVPEDDDGLYDMYDAHVCSAEAPCPVAGAVASPPCDTAESCKAAPTPQPAIFGSPASATFTGAGNVTTSAAVAPVKREASGGKTRCARHEKLRRGRCVRAKAREGAKAKRATSDKRRVK